MFHTILCRPLIRMPNFPTMKTENVQNTDNVQNTWKDQYAYLSVRPLKLWSRGE